MVGGGNSGAQIYAEISKVADATKVTRREPIFMPDRVDGRYLFDVASRQYQQGLVRQQVSTGEVLPEAVTPSLGDIVMVAPVREARDRGVLHTVRPFLRFTECGVMWDEITEEPVNAVIWCTGFKSTLDHPTPLGVVEPDGHVLVEGTHAAKEPRLWLVGYGDWTGYASATPIGVGRAARARVKQIASRSYNGDNFKLVPGEHTVVV